MIFEVKELGENRREIDLTFIDDDDEMKTLKSTSTRTFDDQWMIELMLCFVEEDQLDDVEVEVI